MEGGAGGDVSGAARFRVWLRSVEPGTKWGRTGTDCGRCARERLGSERGCREPLDRPVWIDGPVRLHQCPVLLFPDDGQDVAKSVFEDLGKWIGVVPEKAEDASGRTSGAFKAIEGSANELGEKMRDTFGDRLKGVIEDPIGSLQKFGSGIKDYVVEALS